MTWQSTNKWPESYDEGTWFGDEEEEFGGEEEVPAEEGDYSEQDMFGDEEEVPFAEPEVEEEEAIELALKIPTI